MKNNTLILTILAVIVVGLFVYKPILAPFGFILFCLLMMVVMMNHTSDDKK